MPRRTFLSACLALTLALTFIKTGCTGGGGSVEDSPQARLETARALARLSVETGSFGEALDEAAALALDASLDTLKVELGRELTEDERARTREILRSVLGEFVTADRWETALSEVFAEHFTAVELQEVLDFYRSPVGAKVLDLENEMMEEIYDRTGQAFDGRMDEFVSRVDEALAAEFGTGS